jgi:hypothetical protein
LTQAPIQTAPDGDAPTGEGSRIAEEHFRLLVESVKDYAIFMLDTDGRVISWNPGAQRLKGYRREEILGRHFSRFYRAEDIADRKPERELRIALADGRVEDEGWRVRKDGSLFWANVVLTPMYDNAGSRHIGFAKITRDLTDRRLAEDNKHRLIEAEAAIRMRDEFLSIASHELRTPLGALRLLLATNELLLRHDPPDIPALKERGRLATRQVKRLSDLVDRLLDVSRITGGHLTLRRENIDLVELVRNVIEEFVDTSNAAGCEIRFRGVTRSIVGFFDRLRIEQVLGNLLSNALEHGTGKMIDVSVDEMTGSALLTVSDYGPGISEKDLGRIFERFERGMAPRAHGGLGLGLYITRWIVEAHGGRIHASSAPGKGASFMVRLPLVPASSNVQERAAEV